MAEPREQSDPTPADPFELWRQMYETNEQIWTKAIKDLTSTPSYAEAQGKLLEVYLNYQKMIRDATTAQLTAYNLPSRDDVAGIGELVVGVEEKVDHLDETIARLEDTVSELSKRIARMELSVKTVEAESKAATRDEAEPSPPPRSRRGA